MLVKWLKRSGNGRAKGAADEIGRKLYGMGRFVPFEASVGLLQLFEAAAAKSCGPN